MTETNTAPVAAKRGKPKKGEEAFVLSYIESETDAESRTMPDKAPNAIELTTRDGKSVRFSLSAIDPAVRIKLLALGLYTRLNRDLKAVDGDHVEAANVVVNRLNSGHYTAEKGKGGARGRTFPVGDWVEAMRRTLAISAAIDAKQAAKDNRAPILTTERIEAELIKLRDKLTTAKGDDRKPILDKLTSNVTFKAKLMEVRAEAATAKAAEKSGGDLESFLSF